MYNSRYRRFGLHQSRKKICGVCAFIADKMDWDVTVVRLVTLIGFFVAPVISLVSYFITAFVMPSREEFD